MLQLRVTKHNGSGYHFYLSPECEADWRPLGIHKGCETFVNEAGTLVYIKFVEQPLYTRSLLLQIDPEVGLSSHSSTTWEGPHVVTPEVVQLAINAMLMGLQVK